MRFIYWTFIVISINWYIGLFSLAHASTDPQYATPSATATVPSIATPGDTTPPSSPILIRPEDGAGSGDNTPEFVWRRGSDPNSNTVYYTFYLDGIATFLGISNTGNSAGPGYVSRVDGNEIKLIPTIPLIDKEHTWYVLAYDLSGNNAVSARWSLTIDTVAPHILVSDIDIHKGLTLDSNTPEVFTGLNFDIAGPKDVRLSISTESWSTITTLYLDYATGALVASSNWPVSGSGLINPYTHLDIGRYNLLVSGYDRGGNLTALPPISLTINQAKIVITVPGIPSYSLPYTPYSLPSLPATITLIESSVSLSVVYALLLAMVIIILLIFILKRKPNLILLDSHGNRLSNTVIYHSLPTHKSRSMLFLTRKEPLSYTLPTSSTLYIPNLSRYSTLTVRTADATYILSLSCKRNTYTLTIG